MSLIVLMVWESNFVVVIFFSFRSEKLFNGINSLTVFSNFLFLWVALVVDIREDRGVLFLEFEDFDEEIISIVFEGDVVFKI